MNTDKNEIVIKDGGDTKIIDCDGLLEKYEDYINDCSLKLITKKKRTYYAKHFLSYVQSRKIDLVSKISESLVYDYVNSLIFSIPTITDIKTKLRQLFDWSFNNGYVIISGRQLFPTIRKIENIKILSYYTKEEIIKLLSVIDNTTPIGKRDYLIVCLLVFYGLRIGDIKRLRLSDINWCNNSINIITQKSNETLILPIIEEVKFALLDYIKNSRNKGSSDTEYIFITAYAPFRKYNDSTGFHKIIKKYMDKANINYENKHHGPHSLRHSLATNLMKENIPISAISSILSHSSIKTTEIYLTVDENNLKELSLEVPNV